MSRLLRFTAVCTVAGAVIAAGASARTAHPAITMAGNGGVCSLSTHKTFRMKLTGWQSGSQVQVKVYYANGSDYPFALRNHGVVTVNSRGSYKGHPWPCWPNQTYNFPDKKTTYVVFAFQLGSKPLKYAAATFRVVK